MNVVISIEQALAMRKGRQQNQNVEDLMRMSPEVKSSRLESLGDSGSVQSSARDV